MGIRINMVIRDSRTTAEAVARKMGIDDDRAEDLLQQKGEEVNRWRGYRRTAGPLTLSSPLLLVPAHLLFRLQKHFHDGLLPIA